MAPYSPRPPYATDAPDGNTIYETSPSAPKRRVGPPKPDNPNNRTSAYDVYENYLDGKDTPSSSSKNPFASDKDASSSSSQNLRPTNTRPTSDVSQASRNSGVGGIGFGLMNMDMSDSDDSDDDSDDAHRPPRKLATGSSPSKNAALAAAVTGTPTTSSFPSNTKARGPSPFSPPPSDDEDERKGKLRTQATSSSSRSPPPIAAPRPGYAAPIAALQNPFEPQSGPNSPVKPAALSQQQQQQQPQQRPPPHQQQQNLGVPPPQGGFGAHRGNGQGGPAPLHRMPSSRLPPVKPIGGVPPPIAIPPAALARGMPIPSLSPAPLQAPATPIKPVFAVPKSEKDSSVKFDDLPAARPREPIMRGDKEETLMPRRGEKGDDFWRRFSMIAKDEGVKKESSWLKKTKNGSNRLSRWVWVVGMVLLLLIAGATVLGVLITRGKNSHTTPTVLVGNTSKIAPPAATNALGGGGSPGAKVTGSKSELKVTPTYTIDARDVGGKAAARATGVVEVRGVEGAEVLVGGPRPTAGVAGHGNASGSGHARRNQRRWL